jgi:hydroxymethylpyrimidine pyrophosphatase-like HAD family hydrolase
MVVRQIRDLALDAQIVRNKGSVMVLPRGVDKATGLRYALRELDISPRDAVAVGDAENDECLLAECGCGVAVANALPALRERAQVVTTGAGGQGVLEIIETVLATG